MIFRWNNRQYDTQAMQSYETNNPAMPFIYFSPQDRLVFVQTLGREGVDVQRVGGEQIRQLAERHNLPVLLQALVQEQGPLLPGSCE